MKFLPYLFGNIAELIPDRSYRVADPFCSHAITDNNLKIDQQHKSGSYGAVNVAEVLIDQILPGLSGTEAAKRIYCNMSYQMNKNRIEAFSDGVIAIIITIMVLELKIPSLREHFTDEDATRALTSLVPKILAYLLSFVVVGILWINHHALFDKIPYSTSRLVWHNAFLLFVMSLIPLPTAFIADHPLHHQAVIFYGVVMFLNAIAFYFMGRYVEIDLKLIPHNKMVQRSNIISVSLYLLSIPLAWVSVYFSYLIFIGIPIWYFLPDKFHK